MYSSSVYLHRFLPQRKPRGFQFLPGTSAGCCANSPSRGEVYTTIPDFGGFYAQGTGRIRDQIPSRASLKPRQKTNGHQTHPSLHWVIVTYAYMCMQDGCSGRPVVYIYTRIVHLITKIHQAVSRLKMCKLAHVKRCHILISLDQHVVGAYYRAGWLF
jgi:hypothetical protein